MSTGSNPTDVTLGEIWRGLQRLTETVEALRADMSREVETQVSSRVTVLADRMSRIEKVVYGGVGLVLVAVATAVLALVIDPH